jgi:hypothetical protein
LPRKQALGNRENLRVTAASNAGSTIFSDTLLGEIGDGKPYRKAWVHVFIERLALAQFYFYMEAQSRFIYL